MVAILGGGVTKAATEGGLTSVADDIAKNADDFAKHLDDAGDPPAYELPKYEESTVPPYKELPSNNPYRDSVSKPGDEAPAASPPRSSEPGATSATKEEVDDLSAGLDQGITGAKSALEKAIKGGDKDEIAKATKDLQTLKDAKEMFDPDPAKQEAAIGKNEKSAKEELAAMKKKNAEAPGTYSDEEMAAAEKKASYMGRMKETWGKMDSGQKALALLGLAGAIGGPLIGIGTAAQSQNFDKQKMNADNKQQLAQTQYSNAFSIMQSNTPKSSYQGAGIM